MGSLRECRIEGFICRLCSAINSNVIHIYSEEGLIKKLEQKINVYLKIDLHRFDPLPKVICLACDMKLDQHHRFIQRVIQNQKLKEGPVQGQRRIIPLLEEHLRVRVTPVTRDDGTETNTYNIHAITSSESDTSSSSSNNSSMSHNDSGELGNHDNVNGDNNGTEAEPAIEENNENSMIASVSDNNNAQVNQSQTARANLQSNTSDPDPEEFYNSQNLRYSDYDPSSTSTSSSDEEMNEERELPPT